MKRHSGISPTTLAHHDVAAYLVSEVLGWNIVSRRAAGRPVRQGMVQLWQETDPEQPTVDLVIADEVPDSGVEEILQDQDGNGRIVARIHEDTPTLRRMAKPLTAEEIASLAARFAGLRSVGRCPAPSGVRAELWPLFSAAYGFEKDNDCYRESAPYEHLQLPITPLTIRHFPWKPHATEWSECLVD